MRKAEVESVAGSIHPALAPRDAELLETREHYRRVIHTANDAFVEVDSAGQITEWNKRAEALFGLDRKAALGMPITSTIVPERYRESVREWLLRGDDTTKVLELPLCQQNGREIPVEVTVWTVETPAGMRFSSFIRDISERKRAEQQLQRSEAFSRQILDSSPDCIEVLDLQGRTVNINATGSESLELNTPDEVLNAQFTARWPEPARELASHSIASAMAGHPSAFRGFAPTSKGTPKCWDVRIAPMRDGNGRTDRLLVVSRDITAEVDAETAAQHAAEALRSSEARLKEAQRIGHLGHWEHDLKTGTLLWSEETYRLFGRDLACPITYDEYLALLDEGDRKAVAEASYRAIADANEFVLTHRVSVAGMIRHIETRGRVERDRYGAATRVLGTVLDVTARTEANLELRRSHEELEHRVEQRTHLLAETNSALLAEIEQHKRTQSLVNGQNETLRMIAAGAPTQDVFDRLVRFAETESQSRFTGAILLKTPDGKHLRWIAAPSLPGKLKAALEKVPIAPGGASSAAAAYFGRRVVVTGIPDSTPWPAAKLLHQYLGTRSVSSTPIFGRNQEVLGTVSFALRTDKPSTYDFALQEACASVAALTLLRDQEHAMLRRWEQMFQHASWGMALAVAGRGELVSINPAFAAMLGYAENQLLGRTIFDVYGQELLTRRLLEEDAFSGTSHISYESVWKRSDGSEFAVQISIVQICDRAGAPLYWGANVQNITEEKRARNEAGDTLRQYRFLADVMPQIVWTARADGGTDYFNEQWFRFTGLQSQDSKGWGWQGVVHPDDLRPCMELWMHSVRTGEPYEIEYRFKRGDGVYRWHLGRALPFRNQAGEIVKWFGTCTDIHHQKTEKQRLEAEVEARTEQLRCSLTEKETLLKEVHHRVKNNLQVISSLLRMQGDALHDQAVSSALKESQQRVLSMALIHERLYGNQLMNEIDFGEYTQTLVGELFYSYSGDSGRIVSRVRASRVLLNIDQAIPCGLILNELVTNALKYAYPGSQAGEVLIELEEREAGNVRLSVIDYGAGMPAGLDWKNLKSLGLPIVAILAKQLGGTLDVISDHGMNITLEFTKDAKKATGVAQAAGSGQVR